MLVKVGKIEPSCYCATMAGTDPQLLIFSVMGLNTLILLLVCFGTWYTSRAKKVRTLEDAILSAVRTQRERADQVDVKLGEWGVTIQGMLAEVEEFFERSVKERKRSQMAANRAAEGAGNAGVPELGALSRSDQISVVRGVFASEQR